MINNPVIAPVPAPSAYIIFWLNPDKAILETLKHQSNEIHAEHIKTPTNICFDIKNVFIATNPI